MIIEHSVKCAANESCVYEFPVSRHTLRCALSEPNVNDTMSSLTHNKTNQIQQTQCDHSRLVF